MADVELGQRNTPSIDPKPAGYAQWASWIASDPDNEPLVFRKFDELSALNLLYLQSELMHLESQIKELDVEEMRQPDIDAIDIARQWEALLEATENTNPTKASSKACIELGPR